MTSILLEHELHIWYHYSANLGACDEANRLLTGFDLYLVAEELFDLDLTFGFLAVNHVAEKKSFILRAILVRIVTHQHYVHLDEADLANVAQIQSFHELELSFVVEHMKAFGCRDCDHVQILEHGEGECFLTRGIGQVFRGTIEGGHVDFPNDSLRL